MYEEIPQRELRNNVSAVLKRVADGEHLRVTVHGKPVADLTPTSSRQTFVPKEKLREILLKAPLDAGFTDDLNKLTGQTIDEI